MARSPHLSYANVTASLALFLAMSGGAYAAAKIDSGDVKNSSLTGADVKNNSIRSKDVAGLKSNDFAKGTLRKGADGAQGPVGPQGARGIPGPIAGTPAGGVLSGTYPDPGLALPGARAIVDGSDIPNSAAPVNLVSQSYDTAGMYTPGDDFITVPRTGTYLVSGSIHWNGGGPTERQLRLKNNEGDTDEATLQLVTQTNAAALLTQQAQGLVRLTAGDKVGLETYQETGSAVPTANFDEPRAWLAVQFVSG